jgi:hypothetical protein
MGRRGSGVEPCRNGGFLESEPVLTEAMMLSAAEVVDNYYLETRCMLLDIAATLDRLDRAAEGGQAVSSDPRVRQIYQSLALLADHDTTADRAERLLNLFSDLD